MLHLGRIEAGHCGGVSRRAVLEAGGMSALGLSLPAQAALAARASQPRSVILLWLWGGPPHLDTVDPKPDAPAEFRGPYRAIGTAVSGIQVTELLPRLAARMADCSLIRTLHHGTSDHGLAGTIAMTGRNPAAGQVYPHAGSVVGRLRGAQAPLSAFLTVGERLKQGHRLIQGEGGGMLGAVYDPFRVEYDPERGFMPGEVQRPEQVDALRAERRVRLHRALEEQALLPETRDSRALDRFYDRAFELITSSEGRRVFDLEHETPATRERYGRHRFGQSCLLARRLVETGVPFVQVNWSQHVEAEEDAGDGGWDNHYRNFEMLAERQCVLFDQAYAALLDDLRDRGLLQSTLVVAVGEFGRTPRINQNAGRDHWQSCYSAILSGGGTRGGQVVGQSDERGEYPASRPVTPSDLCLSMLHTLGITRTDVLALGLPVEGEVIEELF